MLCLDTFELLCCFFLPPDSRLPSSSSQAKLEIMEAVSEGRQLMSEGLIIPRLSSAATEPPPSSRLLLLLLLALLSMKLLTEEERRVFADPEEEGVLGDFGSSFLADLGEDCLANCCFLLGLFIYYKIISSHNFKFCDIFITEIYALI